MRYRVGVVVVLAIGCGPTVAGDEGGGDGSGESGGTPSTTSGATASTTGAPSSDATKTSEPVDESGAATLDVGGVADVGSDRPQPPNGCDLPDNPNSSVSGETPDGERSFTAAAFAESGGGKCTEGLRIVLAPDPSSLATQIAAKDDVGFSDALEVFIDFDIDGPANGEWPATMVVFPPQYHIEGTANVMILPDYHSPAPLLQLEIVSTDPAWTLAGMITAHYCEDLASGPCGA